MAEAGFRRTRSSRRGAEGEARALDGAIPQRAVEHRAQILAADDAVVFAADADRRGAAAVVARDDSGR